MNKIHLNASILQLQHFYSFSKEIAHNIAKQCIRKDKFYLTILKDDEAKGHAEEIK